MEQTGYPANADAATDTAYPARSVPGTQEASEQDPITAAVQPPAGDMPGVQETQEMREIQAIKARYPQLAIYQLRVPLEGIGTRRYYFARPNMLEIQRFVGTRSRDVDMALRNLLNDCVISEQRDQLQADLREYPALSISLSEPLLRTAGLTEQINLTRL